MKRVMKCSNSIIWADRWGVQTNMLISCREGKSGYCNQVLTLFYEIVKYSFNRLTETPHEKGCTWRVGSPWRVVKETTIRTTLISSAQKKEIPPTLYDARLNSNNQTKNVPSMSKLKSQHSKIDKNISFTYVIPDTLVFDDTFFN